MGAKAVIPAPAYGTSEMRGSLRRENVSADRWGGARARLRCTIIIVIITTTMVMPVPMLIISNHPSPGHQVNMAEGSSVGRHRDTKA